MQSFFHFFPQTVHFFSDRRHKQGPCQVNTAPNAQKWPFRRVRVQPYALPLRRACSQFKRFVESRCGLAWSMHCQNPCQHRPLALAWYLLHAHAGVHTLPHTRTCTRVHAHPSWPRALHEAKNMMLDRRTLVKSIRQIMSVRTR